MYPLKFKPLFKDYIWGGRNLESIGKKLPEDKTAAESWEISCHPDGLSIISNGEYKGMFLAALVASHPVEITGQAPGISSSRSSLPLPLLPSPPCPSITRHFPLLVKLIDANDDLSVQVHPGDKYACDHENGESGKNEMWYVLRAKPGARLICGLKPGISRANLAAAAENGTIRDFLIYTGVTTGDVINVPAGAVHAIGKGLLIAEIQQNSNATYRIWDYGRTDIEGKKRPLHLAKALDVIYNPSSGSENPSESQCGKITGAPATEPAPGVYKTVYTANSIFSMELYEAAGTLPIDRSAGHFDIFVFIDGEAEIIYGPNRIHAAIGESVLVPAALSSYHITGNYRAIRTFPLSS